MHAEEHQGWVPSTYLQPVNGSSAGQAPCAEQGQGEVHGVSFDGTLSGEASQVLLIEME